VSIIEETENSGYLELNEMEIPRIEILRNDLVQIPSDESKLIEEIIPTIGKHKILLKEYGL